MQSSPFVANDNNNYIILKRVVAANGDGSMEANENMLNHFKCREFMVRVFNMAWWMAIIKSII